MKFLIKIFIVVGMGFLIYFYLVIWSTHL